MSVTTAVLLEASRMPTPEAWAEAVRAHGFDVTLDLDFDPRTFEGFLPCQHHGQPAGFEYYWDAANEETVDEEILAALDGRDAMVNLVTHADLRELVSAVVVAGVLAELTGGLVWDTESGELIPPGEAVAWARSLEQSVAGELGA